MPPGQLLELKAQAGKVEHEPGTEAWRRNLTAIWLAQVATQMGFSFVFPFIPLYIQTLGVTDTVAVAQWAGAVVASSAAAQVITQPIWGHLSDRYGRKPMVVRSMVGGSVVGVMMGLVATPWQLLLLRILHGALTGTISASNALIATSTPRLRLGFSLGAMQMGVFIGNSLGPVLGGIVSTTFGFRAAYFMGASMLGIGGAIVALVVREKFTPPPPSVSRPGVWAESRAMMAMAMIPALTAVIFLIQLGGTIVTPFISLFVSTLEGGEQAATAAGMILGATGVCSAASAVTLGRISDRVGHSKILLICLLGAAATYFPQAIAEDVWQLLLLRALLGVFLGGLMPTANALLVRAVPESRRGAAFGVTSSAMALANGVGPVMGAAIATQLGMRAVFLATGGVFALGLVWTARALRRR